MDKRGIILSLTHWKGGGCKKISYRLVTPLFYMNKIIMGNKTNSTSGNKFHAEAVTIATEDAGAAYQAPSLIAAGADAQHISLLGAVLNLPVALMYFKLPSIMNRFGSRKRALIRIAFLDALTWLPLIAVLYALLYIGLNISILEGKQNEL